jgi:hypothetical protein
LGLKNCKSIIANPDRKNIFYKKVFRHGQDVDAIPSILEPIEIPLILCGFAYKLFEYVLGTEQYFPHGSATIPENCLFAQFHTPQTSQMKDEILKQLCSGRSIVRVIFATVALGMGVDIPHIRHIVHTGPPTTAKAYLQETGCAGRDGNHWACLYYNNRDIAKKKTGMQDDMCDFCSSSNTCLRKLMLKSLDYEQHILIKPLHLCCNVYEKDCTCFKCSSLDMENL